MEGPEYHHPRRGGGNAQEAGSYGLKMTILPLAKWQVPNCHACPSSNIYASSCARVGGSEVQKNSASAQARVYGTSSFARLPSPSSISSLSPITAMILCRKPRMRPLAGIPNHEHLVAGCPTQQQRLPAGLDSEEMLRLDQPASLTAMVVGQAHRFCQREGLRNCRTCKVEVSDGRWTWYRIA